MKTVYIAGTHGASGTYDAISRNIAVSREYAHRLAAEGIGFYCPHTHTAHFEVYHDTDELYYGELHLYWLQHCDALFLLPDWESSSGSKREKDYAELLHIPVFENFSVMIEWIRSQENVSK